MVGASMPVIFNTPFTTVTFVADVLVTSMPVVLALYMDAPLYETSSNLDAPPSNPNTLFTMPSEKLKVAS